MQIVLASTSPFRQQLLRQIKISFLAVSPTFDESSVNKNSEPPRQMSLKLAQKKGESVANQFPSSIIVASDQMVSLDGQAFSKPGSSEMAVKQLGILQGKTHTIDTAVWMQHPKFEAKGWVVSAKMSMRALTPPEIERYVELENPIHSAGSYKIEGAGIALFEEVQTTDFYSIVGLPLISLVSQLREWGYALPFALNL